MKYIKQVDIDYLFKTVSYSGQTYKTPKRPVDEIPLNDLTDRYLTQLFNENIGGDTFPAGTASIHKKNPRQTKERQQLIT